MTSTYTPDQARVAEYIVKLTGVGGGDDPIGFLIASHSALSQERSLKSRVTDLEQWVGELKGWRLEEDRSAPRSSHEPPDPVRGCICPPTSEQTCQGPLCPRRSVNAAGIASNANTVA